jgi:Protein of unknown function (DUF1402)
MHITVTLFCLLSLTFSTLAQDLVPSGNRNSEQPAIPNASKHRTAQSRLTFEAKYQKVLALLKNDEKLRSKIKTVARTYNISPVHIAGAIVGEHTYNVDAYDRLQTYYVKALSYVDSEIKFEYDGEAVEDFVTRPQFKACVSKTLSDELWTCRERVWNADFRGKTIDGVDFPNERFSAVFFQPFYSGQTFGIGQMSPLTALKMSDSVHKMSGLPKLDVKNANEVYRTIMDPDKTLPYVAATIAQSIEVYKRIAGFDISNNPGLTATLYNLGDPELRAQKLAAQNKNVKQFPQENYYGWLVNDKINDLNALF